MLNPIKLVKTYKIANQVEAIIQGMTMKNWITGLHGLVILLLQLSTIWAPSSIVPKIHDTEMVLIASGFFVSKDFNQHSTVSETQQATVKQDEKTN